MSERLVALADAADGGCTSCREGKHATPFQVDLTWRHPGPNQYAPGGVVEGAIRCNVGWIRTIVSTDRLGLGGKSTSEWRKEDREE